ncbi:zebrafish testis-expressed 38 [Cynoglossus semilaevis]|uniref:zebrafish testis-expressed 38 n=1 Tax=Cynoglossus semilaevis TaxID=244447 RepID=UPI000495D2D8|nr:HORMA domain-containing protein 1-like [Cynoglossus semilaevis]
MAPGKMAVKKKQEETTEWTGLFMGDLKTKQESLVFVKRMMALAVSSITYIRGIFPEDAYRSRYIEDLCVKVLREDFNRPGACKVVKWMMGCFDALEKQYLQIVFIGVHTNPDEPNCIIESYQFKIKYTDQGPEMDILRNNLEMEVTADVKTASVLLIRKLILLLQNLDPLPKKVYLNMKLYYYDEVTPEDYQPPGFKEGDCDRLWFEGTAVHFRVGEVPTNFHSLKLQISTEQGRLESIKKGGFVQTDTVLQGNHSGIKAPSTRKYSNELPSEDESAQFKKPKRPTAKKPSAAKSLARRKRKV